MLSWQCGGGQFRRRQSCPMFCDSYFLMIAVVASQFISHSSRTFLQNGEDPASRRSHTSPHVRVVPHARSAAVVFVKWCENGTGC
jgi:hypothetical protein